MTIIPTISLEKGFSEDIQTQKDTVKQLRTVCETVGFFYLTDHGISDEMFQALELQTHKLFQTPNLPSDPVLNRGYTAMGEETLDPRSQKQGDTKEGYYIGREVVDSNPARFAGPNVWPPQQDEFRSIMMDYFDKMMVVGQRVVRLLALSLGLEAKFFDEYFTEPLAVLRMLHYNSTMSDVSKGILGAGAHSDYGMITLLWTDRTPGLEVWSDNAWQSVEPKAGHFIVNLGDMLERWTNGMYRSTKHRVVVTSSCERYSAPFFYEPNFDAQVSCLDVCTSDDNPPKYPPITSGEHLLQKYKETHTDFTPAEAKGESEAV